MDVRVYHFSATGTTERIATAVGRALDEDARVVALAEHELLAHTDALDLIDAEARDAQTDAACAVFAVPVFAGRVPRAAAEAIGRFHGNGTCAASIVVYGNRDFDDALLELNDLLERQGFAVQASAAFVAQHSMLPTVAAGRPDAADLAEAESFARSIAEKLATLDASGSNRAAAPCVPGNRPYKEAPAAGWVPEVSGDCTRCGICAERCPAQAIPHDTPNTTGEACFECMRCAMVCPEGARGLPGPVAAMIAEKLGPIAEVRKPNRVWL
ncbi:4Fe-4S dicluster domain-containing protein [Raoultibacter phocaeensis]|uniref:4Fe-4S dicluster domain-containing protein n=1 Tax=Raoultibacter phocaeensis TaxID=2479841 RepID=UPI00111A7E5F|nr:4Fe-4S dicluster domain-containing protein [Raoultibacter phocaeensis]